MSVLLKRRLTQGLVLLLGSSLFAVSAAEACSLRRLGKCAKRAVEVVITPATAVVDVASGRPVGTTAEDVTSIGSDVVRNVTREGEQALQKIAREGDRAVDNTLDEAGRGVRNVGDAGTAIGRFVEHQVRGYGDTLEQTERRLRQGKLADALWHVTTDPVQTTETGAAEAAKNSSLVRTVGAVAASAYGGPGGAAAYTSWYTYRQTGDPELAIRAGVLSGASSAAFSNIGAIDAKTSEEVAKKAILAGAVGGMAVAAAGGGEQEVLDGFLRAGGMVLVQEAYRSSVESDLDGRSSVGAPYCMAAADKNAECAPNPEAYIRDSNGEILRDENGLPQVDVRRTDLRRPHVGKWAKTANDGLFSGTESDPAMVAVSRIPGMNAMSVFHDHWSVDWHMGAFENVISIIPAVVLTYYGTDAPITNLIADSVIAGNSASGPTRDTATFVEPNTPLSDLGVSTLVTLTLEGKAVADVPEFEFCMRDPSIDDAFRRQQRQTCHRMRQYEDYELSAVVFDTEQSLVSKLTGVATQCIRAAFPQLTVPEPFDEALEQAEQCIADAAPTVDPESIHVIGVPAYAYRSS